MDVFHFMEKHETTCAKDQHFLRYVFCVIIIRLLKSTKNLLDKTNLGTYI